MSSDKKEDLTKVEQVITQVKKNPVIAITIVLAAILITVNSVLGAFGIPSIPEGLTRLENVIYHPTPTVSIVKPPPIGTTIYTYKGNGITTRLLKWSPDGKRIASITADGNVLVWDAATGQNTLSYHSKGVNAPNINVLAWSPDSSRIASGSNDGTLQIRLADTGLLESSRPIMNSAITAISWSYDGSRIAIGGNDGTWSIVETVEHLKYIDTTQHYMGSVIALAWLHDGTRVAVGGSNLEQYPSVEVWDTNFSSSHPVLSYNNFSKTVIIEDLAWSPDGHFIAATTRISINSNPAASFEWDVTKGQAAPSVELYTQGLYLAWACDSRRIVFGGVGAAMEWDNVTRKQIYTYKKSLTGFIPVSWSPDGTLIASGSSDGRVFIWQASEQALCHVNT